MQRTNAEDKQITQQMYTNKEARMSVGRQLHTCVHSSREVARSFASPRASCDTVVMVTSSKKADWHTRAKDGQSDIVRSISKVQREGLVRKAGRPSLGLKCFDLLNGQACRAEQPHPIH